MKFTLQSLILIAAGLQMPLAKAIFTGRATYYSLGATPPGYTGLCGTTNIDSDLVVALPTGHYAGGNNCGRNVQITSGGSSIVVEVVDECLGCGTNDLDLSQAAFTAFAPSLLA
ncbi:RlpA-like double-psi beta-barrel-protein domain-containing protein-containing protein [Panaeolus papilionaceus]|nr:RlpA-like double-psi beta-barrel-protein domain-containing protein-containing protein [Panaeolus papilionaceus]